MRRSRIQIILLLVCVSGAFGQTFPLMKSANGRYLVDQDSIPFQIRGIGTWGFAGGADSGEVRTFLLNMKAKGFNTIYWRMMDHDRSPNAPNNSYNVAPFSTLTDFTTYNVDYYKVDDAIMRLSDSLGFLSFPIPAYFGYVGTEGGWDTEMAASGNSKVKTYAKFIGGRYKDWKNVIWVGGGDRTPTEAEMVTVDSLRDGIREAGALQWWTNETASPTSAAAAMRGRTWLDLNNAYCYSPAFGSDPYVHVVTRADYARDPVQAFFFKESWSETYHISDSWTTTNLFLIRSPLYWSLTTGACGAMFQTVQSVYWENGYWEDAMESDGTLQASYCWDLFESKNWWTLVPDLDSTVMTAGHLSAGNLATTACASDSSTIIAYLPTNREVTMNTNPLKSGNKVRARWYNPILGTYTEIGLYDRTASQAFTPSGSQDWVLVLDSQEPYVRRFISRRP